MLHVSGGVYLESCAEPHWWQLYGSGGRAAAALVELSDEVVLSTYISNDSAETLALVAASYGFHVLTTEVVQTPSFGYIHGLSEPVIWPPRARLQIAKSIQVEDEKVLRFGFLEGDVVVRGQYVVYDPQAPGNPRAFTENGSEAEHLAIVANEQEVSALMGGRALSDVREILIIGQGAEVVVVKRGVLGVLVVTEDITTIIPAMQTDTVWPIGSGDVFSAVFAHYWAEQHTDPVASAQQASLATAFYCSTRTLPIPADPGAFPGFNAVPLNVSDYGLSSPAPQIYLAGPFFTMGQRWIISETKTALENVGMRVFSPLHDVGFGHAAKVAVADLAGLDQSQALLAIADGLDAGTLFEIGYARAKGIPVVAFAQNESPGNLTMLEGTGCRIINDFASAVYNAVWEAIGRTG